MNTNEILDLINESINKLQQYNSEKDSYISDIKNRENHIQKGRALIESITRGPLSEDKDGRDPDFESIVGKKAFDALNKELKLTSLIVRLLKGDISQNIYNKEVAALQN